jgi:hypothetical protein
VAQPEKSADPRREEALREYFFTQERIDAFDGRTLLVKSWSVTASGAGFAFAISQKNSSVLLLTALTALVFWYIEAQWKSLQHILIEHSQKIERCLQEGTDKYVGPSMSQSFSDSFESSGRWRRMFVAFKITNTAMPHILIVVAGAVAFLDAQGAISLGLWRGFVKP